MRPLETERLLLRAFKREDEDDCLEYLSDRDTCYMDGGYEPWLEKNDRFYQLMDLFETQDSRYMIELKGKSKVIGTIFLRKAMFRVVPAIEIGYCLSPNYRRRGYMSEALHVIFEYLFYHENIQMICAKAYERNTPSINLLKSLGFIYEGKLAASFKYPGRLPEALECFYLDKDHYVLGKEFDVIIDRFIGSQHPNFNLTYELNYGYISNIKAKDNEEQDAYILGVDSPVKTFRGKVIAIVKRINDCEDKWIISNTKREYTKKELEKLVHFQEQFFEYDIIMREKNEN